MIVATQDRLTLDALGVRPDIILTRADAGRPGSLTPELAGVKPLDRHAPPFRARCSRGSPRRATALRPAPSRNPPQG